MFLTALCLGLLCTFFSALGAQATFRRLGLDVDALLLWFGLAELPADTTPQRRRRARA